MKSNVYNTVRFITALATILLFAAQSYIPKKSLLLHPKHDTIVSLNDYSKNDANIMPSTWIDKSTFFWRCKISATFAESVRTCGVYLSWSVDSHEGESQATTDRGNITESTPTNRLQKEKNQDHQRSNVRGPCLNKRSDIDGDGFGLEYGEACKVRTSTTAIALCSGNIERPLSETWGWEDNDFCKIPKTDNTSSTIRDKSKPENSKVPSVELPATPSINFSKYDTLRLKIFYEGRASDLRVYLRNTNPKYVNSRDLNSTKFMSTLVLTEDLTTGVFEIKLSDFRVAEWWLLTYSIPRELSAPEFDKVIGLGIELDTPGTHKTRIESIEITGEWLRREDLLISIALFWFLYLTIESLIRYISLRERTKQTSVEIDHLTQHTQRLKKETSQLQELSITDPLTGIFNRTGVSQLAKELFKHGYADQKVGLLILDIDHFKLVNDSFGHDIGDNILKRVTNIISENIRENDIFGRWGGEEFVLLCPKTGTSHMMSLAEKLRSAIERSDFEPSLGLDITISIGATSVKKSDTFNDAFKRADIALYTAKNLRNEISFQA